MSKAVMAPTPGLILLTILGTLAYLGLAVLGWGGFADFFAHPARVALAITVCLLAGAALFSGGNLSPGEHEDRANRWVLVAFGLIGVLSAWNPNPARWTTGQLQVLEDFVAMIPVRIFGIPPD